MTYDLNALLKQRAEATGVSGDRVPFEFGGKTFTFRDPMMLTDDDKDELADLEHEIDIVSFYMGDDQYEEFVGTKTKIELDNGETIEVQGSSNLFMLQFNEYLKSQQDTDNSGRPLARNRSQRRAAAGNKRKRG